LLKLDESRQIVENDSTSRVGVWRDAERGQARFRGGMMESNTPSEFSPGKKLPDGLRMSCSVTHEDKSSVSCATWQAVRLILVFLAIQHQVRAAFRARNRGVVERDGKFDGQKFGMC